MLACCDLCYEKYINDDAQLHSEKTINVDLLVKIIEERTNTKFNKDKEELLAKAQKTICRCHCHIVGTVVIH